MPGMQVQNKVIQQEEGKRQWRFPSSSLLIVLVWLVLLPLANPRVYATDEVQYYVYLRSLRFDGDLSFENEYRQFAALNPRSGIDGSLLQPNRIRPLTGLYGNIAPVGCAILWAPSFLAADGLVQLANLGGAAIPVDGYSWPYLLSVCYASALYGLAGLLICRRLALYYASPAAATIATVAIWLASPLVFYMFVQMPFAHATGFFLTSLFLLLWQRSRQRRSLRMWALLGLIAALMSMTREQLGLFVLLPALDGVTKLWQALQNRIWQGLAAVLSGSLIFVLCLVIGLLPQFVTYQVLNGVPRPANEVSGRINWCSPHMIDTLIDYNPAPSSWCQTVGDFTATFPPFSRGAFVWSPLWLVGLAGLVLLWRRDRSLALMLALAFLAQTYLNGAYGTTWHLRGAFGFRRLIECTPIFVLGLALLIDASTRRIGWWPVLVMLLAAIGWNLGLLVNATFFEQETQLRRIGLIWPDTWHWQAELPARVLSRLDSLLFERCRFLENGRCQ